MKAADVAQHSPDVPNAALPAENPILGTWKLQSMVFEVRDWPAFQPVWRPSRWLS